METTKNKGFLGWIERVGNKMPHPLLLFVHISVLVMVLSLVLSLMGVSAIHPGTGKEIAVKNLISFPEIVKLIASFQNNIFTFPVLINVLILATASGICEKTGFFTAAIKMLLKNAKGTLVVFIIAYVSAHGTVAGDVAFLLFPTIAGIIFYNMKRNPVVGIFMAYACVGGAYGSAVFFIPGLGWDVTLAPITDAAAHLLDKNFNLNYVSNHFIMSACALAIASTATFITVKFIEPMFGRYEGTPEGVDLSEGDLSPEEISAVKKSMMMLGIAALIVAAACIPADSPFRGVNGSLIEKSPLLSSMIFWTFMIFLIPGVTYGYLTKKISSVKELSAMLNASCAQVSGFVVLVFIIAQFLYMFNVSNIGTVLAISGGNFLKSINAPPVIVLIAFLLLVAFINLFIISGSAKYVLFAPIFVPMFMQLNLHPAITQAVYRMGDGVTNHLSPLNAFFAILLTLVQKYDKKIGMGTIFSVMIPYTVGFFIVYALIVGAWVLFNIPPGFGVSIFLNK